MPKELIDKIKVAVGKIEDRLQVDVSTLDFLDGELDEYVSLLKRYVVPSLIELSLKDKMLAEYCIGEFLHADAERAIKDFVFTKKESGIVDELIKDIINSHNYFKKNYRLLSIEASNNYNKNKKSKINIFFGLFGNVSKPPKKIGADITLNQTVEITKYERSTSLNNELRNIKRDVFYTPFVDENKELFSSILEKDFSGGMFVLSRMAGLTIQAELVDEKINPVANKILSDYLSENRDNSIELKKYFYLRLADQDSNQINKINYKAIKRIAVKLGICKNIEWNLRK